MMYTASEKLAIIRLVEESDLFVRRTLQEIKINRSSFYRWYQAYEDRGLEGLESQSRAAQQHWNRIPDSVRAFIVDVALEHPDLTPRELAWHITDTQDYFVSESSVYRILKAHDLITSPQFMVMSASDTFQNPTSRVHELWQTKRHPGSARPGESQDNDSEKNTQPAISRLDWRSNWQKSVS